MAISNLQLKIKEVNAKIENITKYTESIINHTKLDIKLPDGYTELEYVQASGNCYTDTLYAPTRNAKFDSKVYMGGGSSSYPTVWGGRDRSGGPYGIYSHNVRGGLEVMIYNTSVSFSGSHYNKIYYLTNFYTNSAVELYDENFQLLDSKTYTAQPSDRYNRTTYLFTLNRNGSPDSSCYTSGYRIYYLKFYENNELVCDIIPCKDMNGTVCFYEAVQHNTLYNKGSGSFVAGPEI